MGLRIGSGFFSVVEILNTATLPIVGKRCLENLVCMLSILLSGRVQWGPPLN